MGSTPFSSMFTKGRSNVLEEICNRLNFFPLFYTHTHISMLATHSSRHWCIEFRTFSFLTLSLVLLFFCKGFLPPFLLWLLSSTFTEEKCFFLKAHFQLFFSKRPWRTINEYYHYLCLTNTLWRIRVHFWPLLSVFSRENIFAH